MDRRLCLEGCFRALPSRFPAEKLAKQLAGQELAKRQQKSLAVNSCTARLYKVGATGFEPATSWSRTKRSSQAELRPEAI